LLWHPKFNTPAGLRSIQEIMKYTNTFIFRDSENSCLKLYGSIEARSLALANLLGEVAILERPVHRIRIGIEDYAACLNGRFHEVKETFGDESIKIEILKKRRYVVFKGFNDEYEQAMKILKVSPLDDSFREGSGGCPVCFSFQENPLTLSCGHTYCTSCFVDQCEFSGESSLAFPVACVARTGDVDCKKSVDLNTLRTVLPAVTMEKLFSASLTSYVKLRPREYETCPTPDCTCIFHPYNGPHKGNLKRQPKGEEAPIPIFHCPGCLSAICTRCRLPTHNPYTCADAVDISTGGDKLFAKWKAKNDVRDCPNCRTPIEKIDGCNHMSCVACKIHLCWFCMQLFDESEDVYEHMNSQHDGEEATDSESEDGEEDRMELDDDSDSTGDEVDAEDEQFLQLLTNL
jgi:hypothetical protein